MEVVKSLYCGHQHEAWYANSLEWERFLLSGLPVFSSALPAGGRKVCIVAISMGSTYVNSFLSLWSTESWKAANIAGFFSISGILWALSYYRSCVVCSDRNFSWSGLLGILCKHHQMCIMNHNLWCYHTCDLTKKQAFGWSPYSLITPIPCSGEVPIPY